MTFNNLKNIRIKTSGGIFKFENYKIYVIPRNKLGFGISPLIDKVIDSKIKLSDSCISSRGRSISDDYIKYTLKKPTKNSNHAHITVFKFFCISSTRN